MPFGREISDPYLQENPKVGEILSRWLEDEEVSLLRWHLLKVRAVSFREGTHLLGGGFIHIFYVHHYLGKIPILTNTFQRGWFNHQLVVIWPDEAIPMYSHFKRFIPKSSEFLKCRKEISQISQITSSY